MRIHYLQHIPLETPGSILHWASQHEHSITGTHFYNNDALPSTDTFDLLIIMGGPMNIYEEDQYPWLADEKRLIQNAIDAGKFVLGICLGSQLIADVIGGKVTRNSQPEIGWWPIHWTPEALQLSELAHFPQNPTVFHWHYDTFSTLPAEAKILAQSTACRHQAFVYRQRVFGFQFHLENTPDMIAGYIASSGHEMKPTGFIQSPEQVLSRPDHIKQNNQWMAEFLNHIETSVNRSRT